MEYFPNSLDREITRGGAMAPAHSIDIAAQICDALFYAHSRDIVHRDIKPHNLLLDAQGVPRAVPW
jgi:serine/threonine protein kinase